MGSHVGFLYIPTNVGTLHRSVRVQGHKILKPCHRRYTAATQGQAERMVSGSDDFTMFLWTPSASKQHVARMTGHVQTVNQVGMLAA